MTSIITRGKCLGGLLLYGVSLGASGCTSPPSVTPLLQVAERAILEESQRVSLDVERDKAYTRQTLSSLEDAYNRDLSEAEALTPAWVREATHVYVVAREAVLEHETVLADERDARVENLRSAASATRRAITLLQRQDQLLRGVMGDDLGRLLDQLDSLRKDAAQ